MNHVKNLTKTVCQMIALVGIYILFQLAKLLDMEEMD